MGLFEIVLLYLAMIITVYLHEVGHFGKTIKIVKWLPIPVGASMSARFRYGGLAMNALVMYLIFKLNPANILMLALGLFNFIHLTLYSIFGSINHEVTYPKSLWKYAVFDDVPNELWFIFIPLGLFMIYLFGPFYLDAAKTILIGVIS